MKILLIIPMILGCVNEGETKTKKEIIDKDKIEIKNEIIAESTYTPKYIKGSDEILKLEEALKTTLSFRNRLDMMYNRLKDGTKKGLNEIEVEIKKFKEAIEIYNKEMTNTHNKVEEKDIQSNIYQCIQEFYNKFVDIMYRDLERIFNEFNLINTHIEELHLQLKLKLFSEDLRKIEVEYNKLEKLVENEQLDENKDKAAKSIDRDIYEIRIKYGYLWDLIILLSDYMKEAERRKNDYAITYDKINEVTMKLNRIIDMLTKKI